MTLPAVALAAGVAIPLLPLAFFLAAVLDFATGARWARVRFVFVLAVYLAAQVAGLLAAAAIILCTRGDGQRAALRRMQTRWGRGIFAAAAWAYRLSLAVDIEPGATDRGALFLVRHASVADTLLPTLLFADALRLRFVLKEELLWDPCLDVVGRRLPNVFVGRRGDPGDRAAVGALATGLEVDEGLVLFPEGTRFSPARIARARVRDPEGSAGFERVLPPRIGGFAAIRAAAPDLDVVVVSHTGFERARTFGDLLAGGLIDQTIHIRVRRYAAADIPDGGATLQSWLTERWLEVDGYVRSYRRG